LSLLTKWKETALKIIVFDVELKSKFNNFLLHTKAIDPTSTVLGLCLLMVMAKIILTSITSNIINLTRSAESFGRGT